MAELLRPDRYPTHCSACRSGDVAVDAQAGDVVCRSCGTVLQDRLEVDDSCTRLENTSGDVTRHRSYHFTAEVEGDVDVEALDAERKRRRFEDQSQWGRNAGPSATLEQLRAAEARRRRRVQRVALANTVARALREDRAAKKLERWWRKFLRNRALGKFAKRAAHGRSVLQVGGAIRRAILRRAIRRRAIF